MGGGGKKGGGDQTVTQTLDPASQRFVEQQRQQAQRAAAVATGGGNPFIGPSIGQRNVAQGFGGIQGSQDPRLQALIAQAQGAAGQFGAAFDPSTANQFFNPFQEQVIGGIQTDFDRQRQLAGTRAAQTATAQGAFGGNRAEIASSIGQADINRQEAQTIGQFRQAGFNRAQQNALGLFAQQQQQAGQGLGLGLQGLQQGGGLDLAALQGRAGAEGTLQQLQQQQRLGPLFQQEQALRFLNLGFGQPGTTQTQQGQGGNFLTGALGGAGIGAQFGPIGAGIGGLVGGLGGLFG